MKGLDLSKFKKIKSDKSHTILKHSDGHELKIAHAPLSKINLSKLDRIPLLYAEPRQVTDNGGNMKLPPPRPMASGGSVENEMNQVGQPTTEGASNYVDFVKSHPEMHKANPPPDVQQWQKDKHFNQPGNILMPPKKNYDPENVAMMADGGSANWMKPSVPETERPSTQESAPAEDVQAIPTTAGQPIEPYPSYGVPSSGRGDPFAEANKLSLQGIQKQQEGAQQTAVATGEMGAKSASANAMAADTINRNMGNFQQAYQNLATERQSMVKDWNGGHIDPNHYIKNMSTGGKIMQAIGLIVGGAGAGLSHQPNIAYDMMKNAINNDIEAQKATLQNKATLLNANLNQTKDLISAAEMTRMQTADLNSMHLKQIAAGSTDQLQRAALLGVSGKLDQDASNIHAQIAMRQALMQSSNNPDQEAGFQQRNRLLRVMGQDKFADQAESHHVPGIGDASREVPADVMTQITARNALNDSVGDLQNFASQHSGSINPATIAQGRAKAALVQDMVRQASNAGVFKEAEKEFMNRYVGEDPTQLFQKYRSGKGYEEVRKNNLTNLNELKKTYGLPQSQQEKAAAKGTPTLKQFGNSTYQKVPGGWKKVQ